MQRRKCVCIVSLDKKSVHDINKNIKGTEKKRCGTEIRCVYIRVFPLSGGQSFQAMQAMPCWHKGSHGHPDQFLAPHYSQFPDGQKVLLVVKVTANSCLL